MRRRLTAAMLLAFSLASVANVALGEPEVVYAPLEGIVPGSFTSTITIDGILTDWGVGVDLWGSGAKFDYPANDWLPSSGVAYWIEDSTKWQGTPGKVGPGYGGQNFDVEAAFTAASSGTVYMGFVSGFDQAGQRAYSGTDLLRTGDLFVDLDPIDGSPSWDFAIALSTRDGFTEGHAYIPGTTSWYTTPTDYPASLPSRMTGTNFTELSGVSYAYAAGAATADDLAYASSDWSTYEDDDHNVVEVSLSVTDLVSEFGVLGTAGAVFHYTQDCGNDVFNQLVLPTMSPGEEIVIPEPGTAFLALGAVLAGVFARRRKRRQEKDDQRV